MRNYIKESEWRKKKYKRIAVDLDVEVAERFLNKLDKPAAIWIREQIEKFLNEK